MKCLWAGTGLMRVSDQLLQCATMGREHERLEAFSEGAGVVEDVTGRSVTRTVFGVVETDDVGLRCGEEGGAANEDGCECFHVGWGVVVVGA